MHNIYLQAGNRRVSRNHPQLAPTLFTHFAAKITILDKGNKAEKIDVINAGCKEYIIDRLDFGDRLAFGIC